MTNEIFEILQTIRMLNVAHQENNKNCCDKHNKQMNDFVRSLDQKK